MASRIIPCTCDPDVRLRRVSASVLERFQGNLKELPNDQYARLRQAILDKGFIAPIFVWAGHDVILDGHQRLNLLEHEGWEVEGGIPVVEIEAADERDAAERLLLLSSAYGKVERQGLYEFTELHGINLREWDLLDLPDFDLEQYKVEFIEDQPFDGPEEGASQPGVRGVKSTVTFPPAVWLRQREEIVAELEGLLAKYGGSAEWAE